jgi:alkylated DNA nucleotide flippase Atl1
MTPTARDSVPGGPLSPEEYAEAVLAVVEAIPAGRVMAYGDIAEFLGQGGPRQVGRVMSHHGAAVAWWRVTRADGSPAVGHEVTVHLEWVAERTPVRNGRADMALARWTPGELPAPGQDLAGRVGSA